MKDSIEVLKNAIEYLMVSGTQRKVVPDVPMSVAQESFDRRLLTGRVWELEEEAENMRLEIDRLRDQVRKCDPEIMRALATALLREQETKKPSKQKSQAEAWLRTVLDRLATPASQPSEADSQPGTPKEM